MKEFKLWPRRLLFVLKAHTLSLFIMVMTITCIYEYINEQSDKFMFKKDIIVHRNYVVLFFIAFAFWAFLFLTFFRTTMTRFYWWINFLVTAGMAWLSCPILILPLLSAQIKEWFDAFYITIGLMVIHTMLTMFKKPIYEFTADFLIKWSIRGMVVSSFGIVLSVAWKNSHIDVILAYFSLLFYVVLIVIFGRTIGSIDFYVNEIQSNEWYYIILIHYNFMEFFALIMLASCKTRCILSKHSHKHIHEH